MKKQRRSAAQKTFKRGMGPPAIRGPRGRNVFDPNPRTGKHAHPRSRHAGSPNAPEPTGANKERHILP